MQRSALATRSAGQDTPSTSRSPTVGYLKRDFIARFGNRWYRVVTMPNYRRSDT
jgi:hypothetical protein